jgi:hypothetical protein
MERKDKIDMKHKTKSKTKLRHEIEIGIIAGLSIFTMDFVASSHFNAGDNSNFAKMARIGNIGMGASAATATVTTASFNSNSNTALSTDASSYVGNPTANVQDASAAANWTVNNNGTSIPAISGPNTLTTNTTNQIGFMTLNQQLTFSNDFTINAQIAIGNPSGGGDGLSIFFSPTQPANLITGQTNDLSGNVAGDGGAYINNGSKTSAQTGGGLGINTLPSTFALALDEYQNDNFGDLNNVNSGVTGAVAGTISWRYTNSAGKLQASTGAVKTKSTDPTKFVGQDLDTKGTPAQAVSFGGSMTNAMHDVTIKYVASTGILTITIPDNASSTDQNYGNPDKTNQSWTLDMSKVLPALGLTESTGMSLGFAASTGTATNNFMAQVDSMQYTKTTTPISLTGVQAADSSAVLTNATATNAVPGSNIYVFANQSDANAYLAAHTDVVATQTVVAPQLSADTGYTLAGADGTPASATNPFVFTVGTNSTTTQNFNIPYLVSPE